MISFLLRRQHNKHVHSFELGSDFDYSGLAEVFLEFLQQREAQLLVCDLAATEMDSRFDLVPVVKYPYRVVLLELVVVLVGPRPELNLLDGNERLFGLGFLLFLLLLVLILAEVDDAANGRLSLRRNFDEIEAFAPRDFERLLRRHYTDLGPVLIDHADLANSYPLIDAHGRHAIPSVSESSPLKAADTVSS